MATRFTLSVSVGNKYEPVGELLVDGETATYTLGKKTGKLEGFSWDRFTIGLDRAPRLSPGEYSFSAGSQTESEPLTIEGKLITPVRVRGNATWKATADSGN